MRGSHELSLPLVPPPPRPVLCLSLCLSCQASGWLMGSSVAPLLVQLICFSGNAPNTLYLTKVCLKQNESFLSAGSDRLCGGPSMPVVFVQLHSGPGGQGGYCSSSRPPKTVTQWGPH